VSDGFGTALLLAFEDLVRPLLDAVGSPEAMERFWYELGWDVRLDDAAVAQLEQAFPLAADKARIEQAAAAVRQALRDGAEPAPPQIAELAGVVVDLASTLTSFTPSALGSLPAPLSDAGAWEDAAEQVLDRLLERYLRLHQPLALAVLLLAGCVRYEPEAPAAPLRVPFTRVVVDWDQVGALLSAPAEALARAYHWDDPAVPFDHPRLLANLGAVLRLLGLSTGPVLPPVQLDSAGAPGVPAGVRRDADGLRVTFVRGVLLARHATYEIGADLLPAAPGDAGAGAEPTGLVLRPRLAGSLGDAMTLGDAFTLTATVAADAGDLLAVGLFPGDTRLLGGDIALGAAVEVAGSRPDPWYLVGTAQGARLEVRSPRLRVALEGTAEDPELRVTLAAGTAGSAPGLRVVIPMGDADALVQEATGADDVTIDAGPTVVWSSRTGIGVDGRSAPQVHVPLSLRLGAFTVQALELAAGAAPGGGFALRAGLDISGTIGPVEAVVQGVGFALALRPRSREELRALPPGAPRPALGNLDVDLAFQPPSGAGLAIDVAGVLTGGGFLSHDAASGLYAGVLELSLSDPPLTLKAIGLITTRLPEGGAGYSVLVLITAEDFPPVPLALGFSLLGVGGLVGVHRTMDEEAVRRGLRSDTLGSVLFPADPVANAPAVIRALSAVFPPRRGSHLLGLMAKIGRTVPPITLDVAVIYEFGARRRLLVLGRIASDLPTPEEDLIRIRLDAVGVVDLDEGSVAIDAVLVDSRIAGRFTLSGAMALRARRGSGFVLAIGGFNPHFTPPPGVPALERVAIALSSGDNPSLRCEAYFALTSNSIQFGARAQLHAAAYGFSIDGEIGFDALVQRNPFGWIVDFHASVQLKHGSTNLFTVKVDGELQGPRPLRLSGKASFEIFWCDFTIRFDRTLVDGEAPPLPPGPDPLAELLRSLADPHSWISRRPAGRAPGVTLRHRAGGGAVLADPLGDLVVRQQVLPLNTSRPVEVYGDAPLAQPRSFALTVALEGLAQQTPVLDDFAPAQFFVLSDDERIAGPSFERHQSGVLLGAAEARFDEAEVVEAALDYQTLVVDDVEAPPVQLPDPYSPEPERLSVVLQVGALQAAASRTRGPARFRDPAAPAAAGLRAPRWVAVPLTDDTVGPEQQRAATTWSQAVAVARARPAEAAVAAEWQVVPVFAEGPA
jgi:uncharacterized protein DUF6603